MRRTLSVTVDNVEGRWYSQFDGGIQTAGIRMVGDDLLICFVVDEDGL